MANLVIYRKYRPKVFKEIVGQEHVVQTLTNSISSGIISHAYLFSGPRGTGKTTIARLLAKALNCEDRKSAEPCNKCLSCTEINKSKSLDLIEIDAASNRGIDDIRELREGIRFAPVRSKYKVFIIDEAHQLTKEAANALLKTLEEPPAHAIFILATTETHKMIPTIISRCQKFDFRPLTIPEITKKLERIAKQEKVEIEKPAMELIALNARGAVRDAEGLFDQIISFSETNKKIKAEDIKSLLGIVEVNTISEFVGYLIGKETNKAINSLNDFFSKGGDYQEFTKALINYLRQALLLKINPDLNNPLISGLTEEETKKLKKQTADLSESELHRIVTIFMEAANKMRFSSIPQLPLELAVVEILEEK